MERQEFRSALYEYEQHITMLILLDATVSDVDIKAIDDAEFIEKGREPFQEKSAADIIGQYHFAFPMHFYAATCRAELAEASPIPGLRVTYSPSMAECDFKESEDIQLMHGFDWDNKYPKKPFALRPEAGKNQRDLCDDMYSLHWPTDRDDIRVRRKNDEYRGEFGLRGAVNDRFFYSNTYKSHLRATVEGSIGEPFNFYIANTTWPPPNYDGESECYGGVASANGFLKEALMVRLSELALPLSKYATVKTNGTEVSHYYDAYQTLRERYNRAEILIPVINIKTQVAAAYYVLGIISIALMFWAVLLLRTLSVLRMEDIDVPWFYKLRQVYVQEQASKWLSRTFSFEFWLYQCLFIIPALLAPGLTLALLWISIEPSVPSTTILMKALMTGMYVYCLSVSVYFIVRIIKQ